MADDNTHEKFAEMMMFDAARDETTQRRVEFAAWGVRDLGRDDQTTAAVAEYWGLTKDQLDQMIDIRRDMQCQAKFGEVADE